MKGYHIYFILLKILIVLQCILIFFKKTTNDTDLYILTDTIFKISVAVYLLIFFVVYPFPGLDFEDILIIRFSAVLLIFDVDFIGLLNVIRKYVPYVPSVSYFEESNEKVIDVVHEVFEKSALIKVP